MSTIVLKTAKRATTVSRQAVRSAVSGAFVKVPSGKKNTPQSTKSSGRVAAKK